MNYKTIVEKWSKSVPCIFILCHTEDTDDFVKQFPKAKISMCIFEEMADYNLTIQRVNNNPSLENFRCDLMVVIGKIPELDFMAVRHLFYLVNPGGMAVVIGERWDNERFLKEMGRLSIIEQDRHITAFIKPVLVEKQIVPERGNVFLSPVVPKIEGEDFVIVTSAIFCEGRNFSVFYPQERFEQTLKTISSIREKIPTSKIILVEMSCLTQEYSDIFSRLCDMVILCQKNPEMGIQLNKHVGELLLISEALKAIPETVKNFYKISGRAQLTDDFCLEKFRGNKMTFATEGENRYNTKFYHIPGCCLESFSSLFQVIKFDLENSLFPCIEKTFYTFLEGVNTVDKLGVDMPVAATGLLSRS